MNHLQTTLHTVARRLPPVLRGLALLGIALLSMAGPALGAGPRQRAVSAQGGITVLDDAPPSIVFGEVIVFELSAHSSEAITGVTLHLQAGQEQAFSWDKVDFEIGTDIQARATVDLATAALPPFSPVDYWWEIEASDGATLTTPPATFYYEDDRFDWQRLAQGALTVHWYDGGPAFAQAALDTATAAYSTANRDIRAPLPERLDLYLYANTHDVQAALQRVGHVWADGHADVALGVLVVAVAPDLSAEFNLRREIPHELTHILVYRATGPNYASVPVWFNEGLAGMNQAQREPDFPAVLAAARDGGQFLRFATLCGRFPADPAQARLAYAQSDALTRFIRDHYGSEGIYDLLAAYALGEGCGEGVKSALGLSMEQLEQNWLDEIVADPSKARWQLMAPWLLLVAFVATGLAAFALGILRRR